MSRGSGTWHAVQVSYRSYWLRKALEVLYENKSNLSLKDINQQTAIRMEDLSSTLQSLNLIKYWKGDHLLCVTQKVVEDHLAALEGRKFIKIVEDRLRWQPPEHQGCQALTPEGTEHCKGYRIPPESRRIAHTGRFTTPRSTMQ